MAGAGSGWRIAIMRPGSDPIGNLAAALADKDVLPEAGGGLRSGRKQKPSSKRRCDAARWVWLMWQDKRGSRKRETAGRRRSI